MDVLEVRIKKLSDKAVVPHYAHITDAGVDLTATRMWHDEFNNLCYGTDLAVEIPKGYVGLLFPRSSNFRMSLLLSNSVGVIDSGYRGEIMVKFRQPSGSSSLDGFNGETYNVGDRIAQLVILPYPMIHFAEVEELADSDRGSGGFGSSGGTSAPKKPKKYEKCFFVEEDATFHLTLKDAKQHRRDAVVYRCWKLDGVVKAMCAVCSYGVSVATVSYADTRILQALESGEIKLDRNGRPTV